MTGMSLELILFKKETVGSSGSRVQRKNKNGLDVIQERLWHGKRIFLEEEIAVNANRGKEDMAMTNSLLDNGVLGIPSNLKPVLMVILFLSIKIHDLSKCFINIQIIPLNNSNYLLVDPCFNGEQDRFEKGIDCGGDCKRKCSTESERGIPWLLWADPTN